MISKITRTKLDRKCCTFEMDGNPHWKAVGRRTHRLGRCKLDLYQDGDLRYSVVQSSFLKQMLTWIPVVSFLYWNPFSLIKNGAVCGRSEHEIKLDQYIGKFYFEENVYWLVVHSNGYFSLTKNEEQIALYHAITRAAYECHHTKSAAETPDILILFAALIHTLLVQDSTNFWGYIRKDRYINRVSWLPDDEIPQTFHS